MYVINRMPQSIDIGFTGETAFRKVEIDLTPWLEETPEGVPSIVAIRPGETEEEAYIAATTLEENILTWEITAGDVGTDPGEGLIQIWLEEAQNGSIVKRGKSVVVKTKVHKAINSASAEVPAAQEAFMEQMTELKQQTVANASAAEAAKRSAETSAQSILGAVDRAEAAARAAEAAAEAAGEAEELIDGAEEAVSKATEIAERMTTQDAEHAIYHLQFYYDDDGDLCQTD